MSDQETERDLRLTLLFEEALVELRAGRILTPADWQARCPNLADDLPDLLRTLQDLDTAADDWKTLPPDLGPEEAAPETVERPAAQLPGQLGRYRLLGVLGEGGMGTVYKAEDPELRRVVALKVPRFEGPPRQRDPAVQRFLREARAAAQLRHPHVCPIYDVGEADGRPYVVMAYVEGESLAERLEGGRRCDDARQAAALARQVAEALAAVHALGIVHRDLKPGNILLDRAGQAVLADFGLAHPGGDAEPLTVEGAVLGTPAYMSPEQAAGATRQVGPLSDVYSLGVVLYRMLTGRLPFEGPTLTILARITSETPPPPSQFRPDLDPVLQGIVLKAMARRPEDRYRDARSLADDLDRWMAGAPVDVGQPPTVSAVAAPAVPTVVRVALPDGRPVTVTVDAGMAATGKLAVTVRERPATRKRRAALAVTVMVSLSLLIGLATTLLPPSGTRMEQARQDAPALLPDEGPPFHRWMLGPAERKADELVQQRQAEAEHLLAAADREWVPAGPRKRRPRVSVAWDVETGGAMQRVELPFVIGVLADLSGRPNPPLPSLAQRKFVPIDRDNFTEILRKAAPRLVLRVPDRLKGGDALRVELVFRSMDDFEPAAVARQVAPLQALLAARQRLARQATPPERKRLTDLDRQLSAQLAVILHHSDFRQLEATWRGLFYLVHQAETSEQLKLRLLNVTQQELAEDQARAASPDTSVLSRKIYEEEFGQLGGTPYSLLVGNYTFNRQAADLRLLQALAAVAAVAQAPFIAAAGPSLFGLDRWTEAPPRRPLGLLWQQREYAAWQAFRTDEKARYVGLTLPRVLARLPYGPGGRPVEGFVFDEAADGHGEDRFLWMSAAWPFAAQVAEAYARYHWPARICGTSGGGLVAGLPVYPLPNEDGRERKGCTEIALTGRRELELSDLGLLPLVPAQDGDSALFLGARSCYHPGPGAPADPAAQLNVLLCASRFTQVLTLLPRDKIGSFLELPDCERWLNDWLGHYVLADADHADLLTAARRPLAEARVQVRKVPGPAAGYEVVVSIRPRFQLVPCPTVPVRLVVPVPRRN
jgi:type VI secretion system protein ImpC